MKLISQHLIVFLLVLVSTPSLSQTMISVDDSSDAKPNCPFLSDGTADLMSFADNSKPFLNRRINNLSTLKINLFKLGLCKSALNTSNPTTNWTDKCTFIINNQAVPTTLEFSLGEAASIPGVDLSKLTEGIYTHAVFLNENKYKFKSKQLYSQVFQGQTSKGKLCYTVEGAAYNKTATNDLADLSVECVDDEEAITTNGNYGWLVNTTVWFGGNGGLPNKTMTNGNLLYLMSDQTTLATIDDPNKTSNAEYEVGVNIFSSPITIDANTTNIDLGFAMKDYGRLEFSTHDACSQANRPTGSVACVNSMKANGFDFRVTVK